MLVRELIEYLKQCNPNARLALSVNEEECTSVDFLDYSTQFNRVCLYEYEPTSKSLADLAKSQGSQVDYKTSQFAILSESVAV